MNKDSSKAPTDARVYPERQLTIMSYNVLADFHVKPEQFNYVEKDFLKFEYRSKLIIDEIKGIQPDVLCCQELDHYPDFYQKQLDSLGYDSFYEMKLPDLEGPMVAWKRAKFVKKNQGVRKLCSDKEDIYAKKQLALFVELDPVDGGPALKIVNVHLFWDYRKENIKYFQAMKVLKWLDEEFKLDENIVICGDFNSAPKSNVMNLMFGDVNDITAAHNEDALKELQRLNQEAKAVGYKKKWKTAYDPAPPFSIYTARFHETIDYIIYNSLSALRLLKVAPLLSEAEASKEKGLPNSFHGSDHSAIMATFGLPSGKEIKKTSESPKTQGCCSVF